MISIQQINYILSVAQTKHFQKASDLCFVTQPTLSMQIKKAEEELGGSLFERHQNPLTLTPFGEEMLPILRDIQQEYQRIEQFLQQKEGKFIERIRIGIIPTIAAYLLSDLYAEWKKLLPHVDILVEELKTEDLYEAIENKQIDLGILAGPNTQPNLNATHLFLEEIKAYTPNLNTSEINTTDLQLLSPWLLSQGNCLRNQMLEFCQLNDEQKWNYQGGNLELLIRMVDKNGGYTLVPAYYQALFPEHLQRHFKQITKVGISARPVREIIGISSLKMSQSPILSKLLHSIQFRYQNDLTRNNASVLNWK